MYKFLALFVLATLAVAHALPVDTEKDVVPILRSEINKDVSGAYNVVVESGDGTERKEDAVVVDDALEVKGSYKYIDDKGEEVEVFYTAGVNGFVPYGSRINPEITAVAEAAKDLPNLSNDEPDHVHHTKA